MLWAEANQYAQLLAQGNQPLGWDQVSWDNEARAATAAERMIEGMSTAGAVPELTASERMIQGMSRAGEDAWHATRSWRFHRY